MDHARSAKPLKVFVRQPFTESGAEEMALVQSVMDLILNFQDAMNLKFLLPMKALDAGSQAALFFAVWKGAPIKTTLLRDLGELCPSTYADFIKAEDLRLPLEKFLLAAR